LANPFWLTQPKVRNLGPYWTQDVQNIFEGLMSDKHALKVMSSSEQEALKYLSLTVLLLLLCVPTCISSSVFNSLPPIEWTINLPSWKFLVKLSLNFQTMASM